MRPIPIPTWDQKPGCGRSRRPSSADIQGQRQQPHHGHIQSCLVAGCSGDRRSLRRGRPVTNRHGTPSFLLVRRVRVGLLQPLSRVEGPRSASPPPVAPPDMTIASRLTLPIRAHRCSTRSPKMIEFLHTLHRLRLIQPASSVRHLRAVGPPKGRGEGGGHPVHPGEADPEEGCATSGSVLIRVSLGCPAPAQRRHFQSWRNIDRTRIGPLGFDTAPFQVCGGGRTSRTAGATMRKPAQLS
jgi:hypothetical protein